MLATCFTDLVGCTVPIQQAALGGLDDTRLPVAVATAGGLGMVALHGASPDAIARALDGVRARTTGVVGLNFLIPFLAPDGDRDLAQARVAAAAARARVVEFFFGEPDAGLVETVHAGGALACWQVGSRAEAVAAVEAGCDLIVAQGVEAGGHVRGQIGLLPLLGEVLDAVEVPVVAAGGIGTGRAMAAALAAGAAAVRVGTRFVAAEESGAHPDYVAALIAARPEDTVLTEAFAGGWPRAGYPHAPHRVLRSALAAAAAFAGDVVGQRAGGASGEAHPVRRFHSTPPNAATTGAIAAMALYAGESVGAVTRVQPAGAIVRELADEAERLLRRWA